MKIRNGFVSNSSSASFVITINTDLPDSQIEEYIRLSDEWLDKYWEGGQIETWDWEKSDLKNGKRVTKTVDRDPSRDMYYERIDSHTVKIKPSMTMFNDWMDTPGWKFIRAINEERIKGLKLVEILQTEDEYMDCNEVVEFEPKCWEMQDHYEDYRAKQNEIELEYQSYLIKTGYIPTEEEVVEFTKNQLNQ